MPEELPEDRLRNTAPARFEASDFLPNGKRRMATSFAPLAQPVAAPDDVAEKIVKRTRTMQRTYPCHGCGLSYEEGHTADCKYAGRRRPTEYPEGGQVRLARPPAPIEGRDPQGLVVGAQPASRPPLDEVEAIVTPEAKERLRLRTIKTNAIAWMLDAPTPTVNLDALAEAFERTGPLIELLPKGGHQPVQKPDPDWIPPTAAKPVNLYVKPVYNTRWPTAEVVARLIVAACKITGESPFEMYSGKGLTTNISRYFVGNVLRNEFNLSAKSAGSVLGCNKGASASALFSPSFAKAPHEKVRAAIVPALAAVIQELKAAEE